MPIIYNPGSAAGGGGLGAGSGLTASGGNVNLGGLLTSTAAEALNGNNFVLTDTNAPNNTNYVWNGGSLVESIVNTASGFQGLRLVNPGEMNLLWQPPPGGSSISLGFTGGGAVLADQVKTLGLQYAANYMPDDAFPLQVLSKAWTPFIAGRGSISNTSGNAFLINFLTSSLGDTGYTVLAYVNVSAVAGGTVTLQVVYTDINNNAQTYSYTPMAATGNSNFMPVVFAALPGTSFEVNAIVAGTITYSAGAVVTTSVS